MATYYSNPEVACWLLRVYLKADLTIQIQEHKYY